MKLLEHYQIMILNLKQKNIDIPITTSKLSSLLSCSMRNTKIIIRKMQDAGWISWVPGKGRGNYSTINLLLDIDSLAIEEAKKIATTKTIDESIQFVKGYCISPNLQRDFIDWLFYKLEKDESSPQVDRLRFPSYRPLPVLDPMLVNRRTENHIMRHLFNQLVYFNELTKQHEPQLAHTFNHNENFTVWKFYLRKGVKFHHGKEMTAEDVCYSFQRHKEKSSAYHWIMENIDNVVAINTYTVKFICRRPIVYFLHLIASLGGSIIPKNENFSYTPVGTGPFLLLENTEDKLTLGVHKGFFETRPQMDEITMYFFPQLYDNKQSIDKKSAEHMNFYHYPYYQRKSNNFNQVTSTDRGSKLLTLNVNSGILANDRFLREAILHFLPPEKLISQLSGNRFLSASRLLSDFETRDSCYRDVTIGRINLNKSLYSGEPLHLYSYTGAGNELDGKWLQEQLNKEGIHVHLHFLSYEELHSHSLSFSADMLLGEALVDESVLYTYLSSFLGEHSLLTHHLPNHHKNNINELTKTFYTEKGILTFLKEIEMDLCKQFSHIHLYRLEQFAIYPSYLQNIHINALGWVDYTKLWYNYENRNKGINP
ncbi:ABC transporter substrate-binding protein [Aquibacillus rhizosphaerae]|uniref:ABC transporter substrate-binding protein n=1 Tax=Aquibacillus rhizosphaerae TaxID=3051431 RepID=A0ABT7L556_9BACI|nr:ABC transporter substrate-binding protein [Aquibacillus sp. LR5S19]MDL4840992.1 ABC transporter substrate-binding protein [Aquibacillus sp. LR5S19]